MHVQNMVTRMIRGKSDKTNKKNPQSLSKYYSILFNIDELHDYMIDKLTSRGAGSSPLMHSPKAV